MAIREDLVASAAQFLQDPSVASATVENKISFLRAKNLTQEEIDAALARASGQPLPPPQAVGYPSNPPQGYYQPYPPQAWQPPPPPAPRRDWRDWFIAATVLGGVGYGLYAMGKRYVYPLVAPPTPDRLEQDKKSIEEQFDKAFTLVEQLAKDTEELKSAELQRTERLDTSLAELESVIADLKSANRRREDDAQRLRDEVQALKDAIPKALDNQKSLTDNRLKEINTELTSLKTLVSQRVNSGSSSGPTGSYLRPTTGNASPSGAAAGSRSATPVAENGGESVTTSGTSTDAPKAVGGGSGSSAVRTSSFTNGGSAGKASIPAWQMAAANQSANNSAASPATPNGVNEGSSSAA